MGAFFGSLVSWLLGKLFGRAPTASRVEIQAQAAAVAQTNLKTVEQGHEAAQAAIAAVSALDAMRVRQPDSIRDTNKYSRD